MKKRKNIFIGERRVGYGLPVFVIAEAGVNHNGDLDRALALIDAAADSGADAVKFQTFHAEDVVLPSGKMADYQRRNIGKTESQLTMLKKVELDDSHYPKLIERCRKRGILFLSTPHGGFRSVDELRAYHLPAYKFGSGDLTNTPALQYAAKIGKPMILGTGMSTMAEVRSAIRAIHAVGNSNVIVLHCTSNYPCPPDEVNLRAMQTMIDHVDALVGYSDHTQGIQVPVMAATLGACVIEKHFTLDRSLPGPDHAASLEPAELKEMVASLRNVPRILGVAEKRPDRSELRMRRGVRKSIVTTEAVKKGERFSEKNLGIKRPGTGIPPEKFTRIIGRTARRDVPPNVLLRPQDFS